MINDSKNKKIVVKALCIIEQGRKLLLCKSYDNVKKEIFFRFVGGTVNFGEKSEEALRREIREELNSEIENLKFITVIENIFTYEGRKKHEICFLYKGDLARKDLYYKNVIPILDHKGFPAEWVSISDILGGKVMLYPSFNYKELFSKLLEAGEASRER